MRKLFHIVNRDRLQSIINDGRLYSDRYMTTVHSSVGSDIANTEIKNRRLVKEIPCHPGLKVGECVPFYFCPRSVMLYVIHRGNHPNVAYRAGQAPVVHLGLELDTTVQWADAHQKKWAFTDANAAAGYSSFYNNLDQLDRIDWDAVRADLWSRTDIKEKKQAEFLLQDYWPLVQKNVPAPTYRSRIQHTGPKGMDTPTPPRRMPVQVKIVLV